LIVPGDRYAELVVCAAPLAKRAADIAGEIVRAGWRVSVITSANAAGWVDSAAVAAATGQGVVSQSRSADEPRSRPRPSAVIVAPATFNTLNKLRAGISDTPALGVLNDAVGMKLPLLVVPMISERLVDHPAWVDTCNWLRFVGAAMMDPLTGQIGTINPLKSGTGDAVAEHFDLRLLTNWLHQAAN
jgi:phosphopantothenoylcysteine synthetase/decarboxylase